MGPAFYVIAILGCGEADSACLPVSVGDAAYASIEACTAATEQAVAGAGDLAFPVVAQCRPDGRVTSEQVMPADVQLPAPERKPAVRRAAYTPKPARI